MFSCADDEVAPRLAHRVPVDREVGSDRWSERDRAAREPARNRDGEHERSGGDEPSRLDRHDEPAGDRAQQDRDEGAHLDEAVATGQFRGRQVLRQDRVLDGAEQRRMDAEEPERREQQRNALLPEAERADDHDRDLEDLDPADESRLLELVGELPRGGREQHERRDEHGADQVDDGRRVEPHCRGRLEGHEHDERILEHVVVRGPEELGPEERREAALAEEVELVGCVHECARRQVGSAKKDRVSNTVRPKRFPPDSTLRFSTKSNSSALCSRISRSTVTPRPRVARARPGDRATRAAVCPAMDSPSH